MDNDLRDLERRAREGDLRAARALERELARTGGERRFDAHGLLAVLREDGSQVALSFGDVTITARRHRGERVVIRATARAPEAGGLPVQLTAELSVGWGDGEFVSVARQLHAQALAIVERLEKDGATSPQALRPSAAKREAARVREWHRLAREQQDAAHRARFLRRVLG